MQTYPLSSISVEEAARLQFKVIDCITKSFSGREILNRGDLGVVPGLNKPLTTKKAERVIADLFDGEACILVRGAGSGAIRMGLHSILKPAEKNPGTQGSCLQHDCHISGNVIHSDCRGRL